MTDEREQEQRGGPDPDAVRERADSARRRQTTGIYPARTLLVHRFFFSGGANTAASAASARVFF